ncbi:MAG: HDIG domain-containing protein [Thermanaerothrix sp.]|nr:HDIG domain-containing protein [Thermanaerothrix sp.]
MTREEALALLRSHNRDESHIRHALAVEAAMRHMARSMGEDQDLWGLAGLLHDLDWEECPDRHGEACVEWLEVAGVDRRIIRAVQAHAFELTGVEPVTYMERALYGVDELTGFIIAVALVRPSRSLVGLEVKSLKKKWKDKAFARGVDRSVIERGAQMLGMPLERLMEEVLEALRPVEAQLGLGGE